MTAIAQLIDSDAIVPGAHQSASQKLLNAARMSLTIIDPMLNAGHQPTRSGLQRARKVIEDAMLAALGENSPYDDPDSVVQGNHLGGDSVPVSDCLDVQVGVNQNDLADVRLALEHARLTIGSLTEEGRPAYAVEALERIQRSLALLGAQS